MTSVKILVSGGQTGADQAGLRAAQTLGLQTGGYAPHNYYTEDGPQPALLQSFGLTEGSGDYRERTIQNVRLSDGTLIFGRRSKGSNLTEGTCLYLKKPYLWVNRGGEGGLSQSIAIARVRQWLLQHKIETLNIAGNRESVSPGIGAQVEAFLLKVLR